MTWFFFPQCSAGLKWHLTVFCLLILSCFGQTGQSAVAVFVSQSHEQPSSASIELYQAVMNVLGESRDHFEDWRPIPAETVASYMAEQIRDQSGIAGGYGLVPVLDAEDLHQHVLAQRQNDAESASPSLIPPIIIVQQTLDAMAVPAGLVVDCRQDRQQILQACALYYYDRHQRQVTAAAEKKFANGVVSAKHWAEYLVQVLSQGLKSAKKEKDRRLLDAVLRGEGKDHDVSKLRVSAAVAGRIRFSSATGVSFFPEGNIKFLRYRDGLSYGLAVTGSQFSRNKPAQSRRYQFYRAGLTLGVHTKALKSLEWSLYSSLFYGVRRVGVTGRSPGSSPQVLENITQQEQVAQQTRDMSIEFAPEVQWELSPTFAWGVSFPISQIFSIDEKRAQAAALPIPKSSWGVALTATSTF